MTLFFPMITIELDEKYGKEQWRRHIDIHPDTVVGFHEINGCGFNEIGVKSLGAGKKKCEEKIVGYVFPHLRKKYYYILHSCMHDMQLSHGRM